MSKVCDRFRTSEKLVHRPKENRLLEAEQLHLLINLPKKHFPFAGLLFTLLL